VHSAEDLANDGLFDDSELKESSPPWPRWGGPVAWPSMKDALPPALRVSR
jgi:hypothetical protein